MLTPHEIEVSIDIKYGESVVITEAGRNYECLFWFQDEEYIFTSQGEFRKSEITNIEIIGTELTKLYPYGN